MLAAMPIDIDRVVAALATASRPAQALRPVVHRFLTTLGSYGQEYEDFQALAAARASISPLPADERRARADAFLRAWDGGAERGAQARLARAGFAQGIAYHHVTGEPALGDSLAPISSLDVEGLMQALCFAGGRGEALATCVAYVTGGPRDPEALAWMRRAHERKEPLQLVTVCFASPRAVNDRLLELMLARPGDGDAVPLSETLSRMLLLQTTGAQDVEKIGVCARWFAARGHEPVAPPISLHTDGWDGGHAGGAMAVQQLLARVWSADATLAEVFADGLLSRMWAPQYVSALCESLPFETKVALADTSKYWRLYRQGRLVVTHSGKLGKDGRAISKLHATVAKAERDADKKISKKREEFA